MNPPYPQAIILAINVPEEFGKVSLVPLFQREKV
jgi:hypothetical protein